MPSLHFGYSLMIGLTIMSIPLAPEHQGSRSVNLPFFNNSHQDLAPRITLPSTRRLACILLGFLYPFSILVAILATANHASPSNPRTYVSVESTANKILQFILDAAAGAIVCCIGWNTNAILLSLLPLEDYLLWCLRMHKPVILGVAEETNGEFHDEKDTVRTCYQ